MNLKLCKTGVRLAWAFFLSATVMTVSAAGLSGQRTAAISGTVRDPSGRVLTGAEVRVLGSDRFTSTDANGVFRIRDVAPGSQSLIVEYFGFAPDTIGVGAEAGETARVDVRLVTPTLRLDEILVEGRVAGQAAALNRQRASDHISSVVDAELVGRLPDQNLAEAVARAPGVALVRDQGEGRYIQIRGADANLTTLSLDGMRMPSPDTHARFVPMDIIPSDMIASVQVNKTLTADLDADAIGGNVDLITRSPKAGETPISINIAGGQNRVNDGKIGNFTGYFGRRFGSRDAFGALIGGSYYQNDRGSQNFEAGWCAESSCSGVPAERMLDAPTQVALRDYSQVKRTRKGLNGTLDYQLNEDNTLFLKGFVTRFSDDEQRYVTTANLSAGKYTGVGENSGTVTGGRLEKELRLRPVSQSAKSVQLGGRHLLGGAARLDYTLQVAQATEDRPQTLTMAFRQSGVDFTYDVSDPDWPAFTVTKGAELDASKFTYNTMREQARHMTDDDRSGRVNLEVPIAAALSIKVGGSARLKSREMSDSSGRFTNAFKAGMPAPTLPLTVQSLLGDTETPDFLQGNYTFGPKVSAQAVKDFWATYEPSVNQDVPRSTVESNQGAYTIDEDVWAGYAMATLDAGPLRLIPGVRIERTRVENTGNKVVQQGSNVTVTPHTFDQTYTDLFPSISARWTIDRATAVRGAVTTSLVRPAFESMAASVSIPDGIGVTATIGNPALLPTKSTGFDFMVERYLPAVGYVSAGVFHKELEDFIYAASRAVTAEDDLGPTVAKVSEPVNGQTGELTGIELSWQQNLIFLPSLLSGLGVNVNYTWTKSSATFATRAGTTSRLPGQAGNAANVGVFYELGPLSLRGGYQFSDRFLEVLGATEMTDVYVASRGQLDLSGSLKVHDRAKLFFEMNNLTNQPLRRYVGKEERGQAPGDEYYRPWGMMGLRVQP